MQRLVRMGLQGKWKNGTPESDGRQHCQWMDSQKDELALKTGEVRREANEG